MNQMKGVYNPHFRKCEPNFAGDGSIVIDGAGLESDVPLSYNGKYCVKMKYCLND